MIALLWIIGIVLSVFIATYLIARLTGDATVAVFTGWMWPVSLPFFIVIWLAEKGADA